MIIFIFELLTIYYYNKYTTIKLYFFVAKI